MFNLDTIDTNSETNHRNIFTNFTYAKLILLDKISSNGNYREPPKIAPHLR